MRASLVVMGLAVALAAASAGAKLPPPSEEAKAKAAEAAARAKWTESVSAFQLCKAQNRVAAQYHARTQDKSKPASAPAAAADTSCKDPGSFAYNPPAEKPLEAAGAHSPPKTATTPPSTKVPHGDAAPKK